MTMLTPYVYADFNNTDPKGRLRLNCVGTADDLSREGIELRDGLRLIVHDEELETDATVRYSDEERLWVAVIDWQKVRRHAGDSRV